jgi:hypothetical protein
VCVWDYSFPYLKFSPSARIWTRQVPHFEDSFHISLCTRRLAKYTCILVYLLLTLTFSSLAYFYQSDSSSLRGLNQPPLDWTDLCDDDVVERPDHAALLTESHQELVVSHRAAFPERRQGLANVETFGKTAHREVGRVLCSAGGGGANFSFVVVIEALEAVLILEPARVDAVRH